MDITIAGEYRLPDDDDDILFEKTALEILTKHKRAFEELAK